MTVKPGTVNSIKAAAYAAMWTFLGTFVSSLLPWVQDVTNWASEGGDFPDVSLIGRLAVSAAASAVGGFLAFLVRYSQSKNVVPGQPPAYPRTADPEPEPVADPQPVPE